jgi:hypothetical protein
MPQYSFADSSFLLSCAAVILVITCGCGGAEEKPPAASSKLARIVQSSPESEPTSTSSQFEKPSDALPAEEPREKKQTPRDTNRNFAGLAEEATGRAFEANTLILPDPGPPLPVIDDERATANGIRKIAGARLTLYTDLPSAPAVDELPQVFAAAIPQWTQYFGIDPSQTADWRMVGYLMKDEERFSRAGLLPVDLPQFLHGFQRGSEFWLYEQPSDYYRRHLLLHEGVHGFMKQFLGGAGPPWYMEGMAELLAAHQWQNNALSIRWFPDDKEAVAYWGRIKAIRADYRADRGRTLEEVLRYDERAHLAVEPYAWSWAAAAFFDTHPRYRDKFRQFKQFAPDTTLTFSQRFYDAMKSEWPQISREWHVFVATIDYGFDIEREAIEPKPATALPADGATVTISADRGWQSSGYLLETGATYRLEASGRYQVANEPKPWWCEPNGVTIRYHNKLPLGMLLGAIVDEQAAAGGTPPLVTPDPIGMGGEAPVEQGGTLFLRINDSPAELSDNSGTLDVRITKVK